MIYTIGKLYKYPNSSKTFELAEVSDKGIFYFKCGHWCTDKVFIDLIDVSTGQRVGDNQQTVLNLAFDVVLNENKTKCKHCRFIRRKCYGSKDFFYCGLIRSNRTQNGMLKIKANNQSCKHFKDYEDFTPYT